MNLFLKNNNVKDNILLQAINVTFIAIIFHYSPIDYECDAANTLLNSKYIYHLLFTSDPIGASYSYRAPIYKIIQIFSGAFLFDSFFPIIFVQIIFSILMPSLFYFTLLNINRGFALLGSFLFIFSLIPILHLKLMLSVHTMIFFVVLSNFFVIKFVYKKKISDFYLAFLTSVMLLFTRFDGAFIFLGQALILSYYLMKTNLEFKNKIKHILKSYSFVFLTIFLWMTIKAIVILNLSVLSPIKFFESFTSLNHQTGAQLYWSLNNGIRQDINRKYSYKTNSDEYIDNLLIKSNGPATEKLYDHLKIFFEKKDIIEHLSFFKDRMAPIFAKNKKMTNLEMYNNHYGNFFNDTKKIADNVFSKSFESLYYPLHIPGFLEHMYGKAKADKLLQGASYEIIANNIDIQKIIYKKFKESYGSLEDLKFLIDGSYPKEMMTPWYNLKTFNSANCGKTSLSSKMFIEYESQYKKNSNKFPSITIGEISSSNKSILRSIIGLSILILLIFIFYTDKVFLVTVLFISYNVTLIFLSIMASQVVNSKSETYTLVIGILIFLFLLSGFFNFINKSLKTFNFKK
jgi:hypothetical protein